MGCAVNDRQEWRDNMAWLTPTAADLPSCTNTPKCASFAVKVANDAGHPYYDATWLLGEVYAGRSIIDACRTPRGIGKADKEALAHLHPQRLGAAVLKAIAERNQLDTKEVDDVIWGTSTQVDKQGADLGRMAALDADTILSRAA